MTNEERSAKYLEAAAETMGHGTFNAYQLGFGLWAKVADTWGFVFMAEAPRVQSLGLCFAAAIAEAGDL